MPRPAVSAGEASRMLAPHAHSGDEPLILVLNAPPSDGLMPSPRNSPRMVQSLIKDSTIYGLGTLLSRAFGLLLIPVYTRYLTVNEYGALALLNLILQNVSFVCLLGVSTAAMRQYFEPGVSDEERQAVYGTASTILICFPPLVLLVIGPAAWFIVGSYLPSVLFFPYVFFTLLTGLFTPIAKLLLGLLRVRRQALWFIGFNLGLLLLQGVAAIVALVLLELGLRGQVYAQLFANGVAAGVALLLLANYARPRLDWEIARRLFAYGLPLVPFFIFVWVYESAGRFMLEHFADLGRVGIFALSAQFAGLLAMAGVALDNTLFPHFLEHAGKAGGGRQLGTLIHKYLTWLGLLGLCIMVGASPAIRLLVSESYFEAEQYVAPLVLAFWLSMARTPIAWSLNYSKQSTALSVLNGAAVAILVSLLFLTLGRLQLGIPGVAYAMIGANILVIAAGYLVAQRHFRLEFPLGALTMTTVVLLTGGGILAWLGPAGGDVGLLATEGLVLLVTGLVVMRIAGIRNPLPRFGIRARRDGHGS